MLSGKSIKRVVVGVSAAVCWFASSHVALAADGPDVMYVQEDWELVLNEPNSAISCPQFHTSMSPTADLTSRYFQVNWNYQEEPEPVDGGLELLNWNGDTLLQHKTIKTQPLSTAAETITWTQTLYTNGNILAFLITNGNSTTWGTFSTTSWDTTPGLHDLNDYSPDVSAANSWITYGTNRVQSLKLLHVRYYDASLNLVKQDDTVHVVYEFTN